MRGGSLQALKELLGHADLKMTLKYAHLSPGHLPAEIDKTAASAAAISQLVVRAAGARLNCPPGPLGEYGRPAEASKA
jgi:hypothetical protein